MDRAFRENSIGRLGLNVPHVLVEGRMDCGVRKEALRRKADLIIAGRGRGAIAPRQNTPPAAATRFRL